MDEQTETIPADQGETYRVGPGCPPREHQWKKGKSGNPDGPKVRRTNLWVWICKYLQLTAPEFDALDRSALTLSQLSAVRIVEQMRNGEQCGSERLVQYCVNRDEGKVADRHIVDTGNDPWHQYKAWRDSRSEAGRLAISSRTVEALSDGPGTPGLPSEAGQACEPGQAEPAETDPRSPQAPVPDGTHS